MQDRIDPNRKIKICWVATLPYALNNIKPQIDELPELGFDVSVIATPKNDFIEETSNLYIASEARFIPLNIERKISPLKDLISLWKLYRTLKLERFDLVHSISPKSGLLVCIAGLVAKTPVRLHTYTGQVWLLKKGVFRYLIKKIDQLIGNLNTQCYTDGHGQAKLLIEEGVIKSDRIKVLLKGSIAGVDLKQFDPKKLFPCRKKIREKLSIPEEAVLFAFVGRLTYEKGIKEMLEAISPVLEQNNNIHFLFLGPVEKKNEYWESKLNEYQAKYKRLHRLGFVPVLEEALIACDVFCLPSYREGFNVTLLQAAALEIPTIGTDVYGINDSIVHNVTGVLIPPYNSDALKNEIINFTDNPDLIKRLGKAARKRVEEYFDSKLITKALVEDYLKLLKAKKN